MHTDYLGTPRVITSGISGGSVVWEWRNDNPYGNNKAQGSIEFNLRFAGQYYDSESGLHYNINRTYNPATGRYMQSDPIGLAGGSNTYNYVNRNPLNSVDPLGLYSTQDLLNDSSDWIAGFGDNLSFGLTKIARNLLNIQSVDTTSNFYEGGEWGGVAFELSTGLTKSGLKSSVKTCGQIHWSHWIPDRYLREMTGARGGKPRNPNPSYKKYLDNKVGSWFINSRLNGNYETKFFHQLTDPMAYNFMSKNIKIDNPPFSMLRSQINRLPYWLSFTGMGLGSKQLNNED